MKKNNKVAFEAFQAVNSDRLLIKLTDFQKYLQLLCNNICPKGFKENYIYQCIFTLVDSKTDIDKYCKSNLLAAKSSLKRIIHNIREEGMNEVKQRMISSFICNLKIFIKRYDEKFDYSWMVLNTNTHITKFYFDLSRNTFYNGIPHDRKEEKLVLSTSATFFIRQSIEYKIKRVLGIDYILLNDKPDKRSVEKYFKVIESNMSFYTTKNFNIEIIKKIHSWTHTYIHGGYRPEPWKTETALYYLNELFSSGETSKKKSFSLYAGIEVKESELENLKTNTESKIKSLDNSETTIKWSWPPEVAIIK